jgi:hypothetical protein
MYLRVIAHLSSFVDDWNMMHSEILQCLQWKSCCRRVQNWAILILWTNAGVAQWPIPCEHTVICYTWSSTYDRLPFWLTGRKSIWSYVDHIFINSIFGEACVAGCSHSDRTRSCLAVSSGLPSSTWLLTWVMGVLSSTFWFIIKLFVYLLFFVVVSRRPSV